MDINNIIHAKETFSYLHEPEYVLRFARAYWRALIVAAAVLIIFFSVYGVRQVVLLSELMNVIPSVASATSPFDRGQLKTALESFREREAHFETLKRSPPGIADPSR